MSDDLDRDLKARFDRELAHVRPPATWSLAPRRPSPLRIAASVAVVTALLLGATVGGLALREAREPLSATDPNFSPSAAPSPTAQVSPPSTPGTSPTSRLATFENAILGYRISFPEGYRRSRATIVTGHAEELGGDHYTLQTEREERDQCLRDGGDVGFPRTQERDSDVGVGVSRNVRGLSAEEWANTPRAPGDQPLSTHKTIEPVTIGGREAVRLVQQGETMLFVIRANDRIYVLSPNQWSLPSRLPKGWLEDIANSFVAIAPAPHPTPTATAPPRVAARELAEALARAFAARDADAVVRLMPSCWLNVTASIDGQGTGGVLYRSIPQFTQGLRERFARGDLIVTIDPAVQVDREELFVRSEWREPDRTTRVDLYLSARDGRTVWFSAKHHYARSDMLPGSCIPYRIPWTLGAGSC